jgi:hypothetical protein
LASANGIEEDGPVSMKLFSSRIIGHRYKNRSARPSVKSHVSGKKCPEFLESEVSDWNITQMHWGEVKQNLNENRRG